MLISFVYLLFIGFGLGFAAWKLLKIDDEDPLTSLFMIYASGVVAFVLATTILGFVGFANWLAYLALAVLLLIVAFKDGLPKIAFPKISKEWMLIIAIFLIFLYVYAVGSLSYPWLEDDDPWVHAAGIRFVSIYDSFMQVASTPLHYLAPYPPFFDVLMGVLYQVDGGSLQSMLKFNNAFLVSMCIPLFYCWAKKRMEGSSALWATAILAALPSFMSHFDWAQTLAVFMAFPALYFIDRYLIEHDRKMGVMAVLTLAAVMISQPSVAAIIFFMAVVYVFSILLFDVLDKKKEAMEAAKEMWPLAGALLLSILLFWGPMFLVYPKDVVLQQVGFSVAMISDKTTDNSGGVVYGLTDFIFAPLESKMDQPTGWGLITSILLIIGLAVAASGLRKGENRGLYLALVLLFVICMVGTEGNLLPVKLLPHRFWVFLAIPVAMLAGIGTVYLLDRAKGEARTIVLIIIILGVILTSAYPKSVVETSMWPPGVSWVSQDQFIGYIGLRSMLPANTKVFSFCGSEDLANGMDLFGYSWVPEVIDYKNISISDSIDNNYKLLKKYDYSYALIDQSCLRDNPPDAIQSKLVGLTNDPRFSLDKVLSSNATIVFKVN